MTERLYYTDAYLRSFPATVVEVAGDGRRVYLDRTAFYPTSGGQPHDTGRIAGIEVVDVVDEDERVAHLLASPLDASYCAGTVTGAIDWDRRFDHMQQHSGQHLLSAVIHELFGYETASVHFGDTSATIDLATSGLAAEQVLAIEERANARITENRPVGVTFVEAARATGLRKAPAREGTIRIVTIEDVDRSACGGTHVRATGEIGVILLRKVDRARQGTRLEFVCGGRAVRQARTDYTMLTTLANRASAAPDELAAIFDKQRAELKDGSATRRELEGQLAAYRARELYDATAPDGDGVRRIVTRNDTATLDAFRPMAHAATALSKAVFIGLSGGVPGVLIGTSDDSAIDAGATLKAALGAVGGRGGGTPRMAQGTVRGADALETVARYLLGAGAAGSGPAVSP